MQKLRRRLLKKPSRASTGALKKDLITARCWSSTSRSEEESLKRGHLQAARDPEPNRQSTRPIKSWMTSGLRIAIDLEIIQSEGFEATKQVDPNMVVKKKDGKDVEVQDGWVGRVLPFKLVQESHLKADYHKLRESENRLAGDRAVNWRKLLETFSDDEKVRATPFTEEKDGFVLA